MGLYDIVSLELDYPGEAIGKYLRSTGMNIKRKETAEKEHDYIEKQTICEIVENTLRGNNRNLVLLGSGYYHHFTYSLCLHADRFSDNYAYIHFDHHNDYFDSTFKTTYIHCGSFVRSILVDTNASSALFIGVRPPKKVLKSKLHMSLLEEQLRSENGLEKFQKKLSKLPSDVYLSFDLDVLNTKIMHTAYDQGTLKQRELMDMINIIKKTKTIISADIVGYADVDGKKQGKDIYAKIISSLMA